MMGHIELHHNLGALNLDVEIPISPGVTAIFGPSGAGKTSILRACAGLLTPQNGRIEIDGTVWFDSARNQNLQPHKRRVGFVFQEPRLFPHLSVQQNLRYGAAKGASLHPLVDLLGLTALLDRRPAHLSGGEAQRVALGRALLAKPRILLMDEPLSALDLALKHDIVPYLEALKREAQVPILYVSHDIDEVARLADHVVLLEDGRAMPPCDVATAFAGTAPASRLGRSIAGGLLRAEVAMHHDSDGLTELRMGDVALLVPGKIEPIGSMVQLRIEAKDVTLSVEPPVGLSALNVLPATITAIDPGPGAGALVRLDHQGQVFAARLTARSIRNLQLTTGQSVHAILKTMSVGQARVATWS